MKQENQNNIRYKPFYSFFKNSSVSMVILDRRGKILHANPLFQEMTGYGEKELCKCRLLQFIHPEDKSIFTEYFNTLVNGKSKINQIENRYLHKNGKTGWWNLNISITHDNNGIPLLCFGIIEDISNRRKGEEELKKAKKTAEEANKIKSAFLANMSHEIRTPIHTIIGMTELLSETNLDIEQKEYTGQIQFSVEILLSLINDILDFSKIEAGKLKFELIDFDLFKIIEKSVYMITLEAHKKDIEIALYIDPRVPRFLRGDPVRLRQVFVNLLNNAVKFTKTGEISISAIKEKEDQKQTTLKFEVKDTGIGIPKNKLKKLFQAFSQADSSTTRKYGGSGLGLSICKNLVKNMHGRIGVNSKEGHGSTFWFTSVFETQKKESTYTNIPCHICKNLKVLIVDDNKTVRNILKNYLKECGYSIDTAENGISALEKLRKSVQTSNAYDLLIIDAEMPGMDGWRLANEINSDKTINNIKLILLTPAGSGDEAKMKLLKWFDSYLVKPVTKQKLFECVYNVANKVFDLEPAESMESMESISHHKDKQDTTQQSVVQKKGRILVAEDHEVNKRLIKLILEKMGHEVNIVNDGREAVNAVSESDFDLIFLDIQMPNMNGYNAAKRIRENGIKTPIIAVTANTIKDEANKCLAAGMNDYLPKPFKKKDLVPIINKWLKTGSHINIPESIKEEKDEKDEKPKAQDKLIFNYEKVVNIFMDNKDTVHKVLKIFIDKAEDHLNAIKDAITSDDFENVRMEAHAIVGSALNLTATRLGNKASELEQAGKKKLKKEAVLYLSELKMEFKEFKKAASKVISLPDE